MSLHAVVRRGLIDRRRAVLTWGLSLGVYAAFMAAIYPSIQSSIEKVAKDYPAGLAESFGVQAMNTVEGYIHAEIFSLIVPLAMGNFAIRAIAGATVGAQERRHLDTILALPISRTVLLTGSYLVAALASGAIMAVTGVMTFAAGRIAGTHISLGLVAAGVMGVWPLALFFGGVSPLAAGALHSSRTLNGIAFGALVAMYAVDLAGRLVPWPARSAGFPRSATTARRCATGSIRHHSSLSQASECCCWLLALCCSNDAMSCIRVRPASMRTMAMQPLVRTEYP